MDSRAKKPLNTYYLIAFIFTWACWIGAILLGYEDKTFTEIINLQFQSGQEAFAFILFRIGVYGPLLAALATTAYLYKAGGLKELWQRMTRWQVEPGWYLYLFLLPVLINLAVVLIGLLIGVELSAFFASGLPVSYIILLFIYQIITSGLEEPGWRGFVLENLLDKYPADRASWILGLVWAIWHFPYLFYLYWGGGIQVLLPSLLGFTLAIIGQTFIISWFYVNTRSIFLAILLHAWLNTSAAVIIGEITIVNPALGIIPGLATWLVVFVLIKRYGNQLTVNPG